MKESSISAASDNGSPGIDRTLKILSAFREDGYAQRPRDLAERLAIPRSSAYQIIRTLLAHGYLEKAPRSRVRLSGRFAELLVASQQQKRKARRSTAGSAAAGSGQDDFTAEVPRGLLWNPQLTETVECLRFSRPPPYRIGFSNASTSNPWRRAMLQGMLDYAALHSGRIAKLLVSDAGDDPHKQVVDIEGLLCEELDLLLVSCSQAQPLDEVLAKVARAGIPVITVDRRPSSEHFLVHVSASDITLGRITAHWMAEKLQGEGSILMLAGVQGSSPAERRVAAAMEVFSQYPAIDIVGLRYTDWREEVGRAVTAEFISQHGIPDGVWCDSGLQGAGSMRAFLELGTNGLRIPPHTGGDVNDAFQLAVRHCVPLAAVEYPACMGGRALQAGLNVLSGKTLSRQIEVHSQIVISRGEETASVHADVFVEDYVRWERSKDFVASYRTRDSHTHGSSDVVGHL